MFGNFLSSSKRPSPPKKASSSTQLSTTSADDENSRRMFQRSASQPSYVMNQRNESGYGYSSMMTMPSVGSLGCLQEMERSSVFGSCAQVLSTVITALVHTVQSHKFYAEPEVEITTTRAAKLLYVSLLERVQKERGEWQGFAQSESDSVSLDAQQETALVMLETHVASLPTVHEKLAVLHELLEVSFRNLRGALVSTSVYIRHRKRLADDRNINLAAPPSLPMLLMIGELVSEIGRDEKLCLFRLLILWNAIVAVNDRYSLIRIIDEQHDKLFSESTDSDYMTAKKGARHDIVAMDVLQLLAQYRDVLFSDLEYIVILQELHARPLLTETSIDKSPSSLDNAQRETDVSCSDQDTATSLPSLTPLSPAVCLADGPPPGDVASDSAMKKVFGGSHPTGKPEPTAAYAFEETATLPHSSMPLPSIPATSRQAQVEAETVGQVPSTPLAESEVIMAVKPSQVSGVGQEASDVQLNLMDASRLELEHNQADLSESETDSAASIVECFEASAEVTPSTEVVSPEASDGKHAKECPAPPRDEALPSVATECSPRKSAAHGPIVSIRHHSLSPLKSMRHTKTLPSNQETNAQEGSSSSSPDKEHATRRPTILWQDAIKVADLVEKSHKSSHTHHHSSHANADPDSTSSKSPRSPPISPTKKPTIAKPRDPIEVTTLSTHYFSLSLAAATVCTMATMAVYALRKPH